MPRTTQTESDRPNGPTLDEIKSWPATISLTQAAAALGMSRAHVYGLAQRGELPCATIAVGRTRRVIAASLVRLLSGEQS
jgi:excisionase family DNA binding protein